MADEGDSFDEADAEMGSALAEQIKLCELAQRTHRFNTAIYPLLREHEALLGGARKLAHARETITESEIRALTMRIKICSTALLAALEKRSGNESVQ